MRIQLHKYVALPDAIRIGGIDFNIEVIRNLRTEDGEKLDGNIRYEASDIRIEERLTIQAAWHVMIHEAIHGILTQAGKPDEVSEETIDAIAYGLMGIINNTNWRFTR